MSFQEVTIIFRYFTLWTWILFFIYPSHPINLINSMISSVGGCYITYIYPKFLDLPFFNVRITGPKLWMIDFLTHHSLFLYQLKRHTAVFHYPLTTILQYHLLFVLYFATCFQLESYHIRWEDVYTILGSYTLLFLVLQRI